MKIYNTLYLFVLIIFASLLSTSCAFNKLFLQPTKIPFNQKQVTLKTKTDSIKILFSESQHQPIFIKNEKDTIQYNFTIESVVFKSNNNNELNGWVLKPKNSNPNTTLLHLHGNAGCLASQFQAISLLVEKGFQVFMFDYSGFGFSKGKATRKNALTDALSALEFIKNRADTKNTNIVIYGQSLGGHLATVVAALQQSSIKGLVIEGAFSSHKDIGNHMVPFFGKIFVKQGYSALNSIKEYHLPLLVIHSSEDKTIPFFMGKKIYDNANQPKDFYEVKECHICAPQFYADSIAQKIANMILIK